MAERVLHQRLEEEIRHPRVARFRVDVDRHAQPVAEAQAHDLHVALQEVELRLQRHFLRADVLEGHAQQVAQRGDHRIRAAHVLVHQRRDGVQGVEEEVRLELHAQHVELRLREPRLELGCAERAVFRDAVVDDRVVHGDERAEHDRVDDRPREHGIAEQRGELLQRDARRNHGDHERAECRVHADERGEHDDLHSPIAHAARVAPHGEAFGDHHHRRREQRPRVRKDQLRREKAAQRDRRARESAVNEALGGIQNGDERRDAEQDQREADAPFAHHRLVHRASETENRVLTGLRDRIRRHRRGRPGAEWVALGARADGRDCHRQMVRARDREWVYYTKRSAAVSSPPPTN